MRRNDASQFSVTYSERQRCQTRSTAKNVLVAMRRLTIVRREAAGRNGEVEHCRVVRRVLRRNRHYYSARATSATDAVENRYKPSRGGAERPG